MMNTKLEHDYMKRKYLSCTAFILWRNWGVLGVEIKKHSKNGVLFY